MLAEGSRARFVTLVYGEGRVAADGGLELRFASAGHPAPVVVRSGGAAEQVGTAGDLLGVFATAETRVESLRLAPGESLVCFTDGVTERREGRAMLGEEGVVSALTGAASLAGRPPGASAGGGGLRVHPGAGPRRRRDPGAAREPG